jgi:glycosyltransferase involved in cell wall biosynthesis
MSKEKATKVENHLRHRGKLRVWIFTPPLDASGGIGALYSYAAKHFDRKFDVTFVDTKGKSSKIYKMLPFFFKAILKMLSTLIGNRVDLAHLNISSHGSAVRKCILGALSIYFCKNHTVFQLHSGGFEDYLRSQSRLVRTLIVRVLDDARGILVFGTKSRDMLISFGVRPEKIHIVLMGCPDLYKLEKKELSELKSSMASRREALLLFAGDLNLNKGLPFILNGVKNLKNQSSIVRLIVAGNGDLNYWKSYVFKLGIHDRVALIGHVPKSAINSYLTTVDGLILASKLECMPVSIIECLSAGKIPITTLAGNLGDVIGNDSAVIMDNQSEESVTAALSRFLEILMQGRQEDVTKNSKAIWERDFDVVKTTRNLESKWREMMPSIEK